MSRFTLAALVAAALSMSACGDSSPTTPSTPVTPSTVTDTFSGTLSVNGASSFPFSVSSAGAVYLTLTSVADTSIAVGMSLVQTVITFPVPSSSGRAVLTMPILVPLSDLLGLSRQVTVTATQFGPGVIGNFLPTDGALMAILALAGVPFSRWLRFCIPLCGILFVLALAAVALAATLNLQ